MNRFITGETEEDSLRAPSFLYTTKNVTALAITAVSADFTVCLITTDDGWLYKVSGIARYFVSVFDTLFFAFFYKPCALAVAVPNTR